MEDGRALNAESGKRRKRKVKGERRKVKGERRKVKEERRKEEEERRNGFAVGWRMANRKWRSKSKSGSTWRACGRRLKPPFPGRVVLAGMSAADPKLTFEVTMRGAVVWVALTWSFGS